MNVDMSAPAVCEESVVMDATPREIWEVVSYLESWPRWMRDVHSVSKDGPLAEGCGLRWRFGPVTFTSTLDVVAAPNELAWSGEAPGIYAMHVYRLRPLGEATVVTAEASWSGRIPRRFPRVTGSTLRRSLRRTLDDVEQEVRNDLSGATKTEARIRGNRSVVSAAVNILGQPMLRVAARSRSVSQ